MMGSQLKVALAHGLEYLHLPNATISAARTALFDSVPADASQEFVLELAHATRRQDRNVPLLVEMDKSLHVEAVEAALTRFHHAEIAAVQLDEGFLVRSTENFARIREIEDAFVDRIRAAVDSLFRIGSDIVIVARTNLLASCDCSKGHCHKCYSRAIKPLQNAAKTGADVVSFAGSLGRSDTESVTREVQGHSSDECNSHCDVDGGGEPTKPWFQDDIISRLLYQRSC
jgi:Phosphoenolpyruvate phosphomutase